MRSFLIFRLVGLGILLLIQLYFYVRITGYARKRFAQKPGVHHVVKIPFVLFNLPLVYLALTRPQLGSFSDLWLYLGVYPFYVWHGSFFFIFLVLFAGELIRLPVRIGLWISKIIPPLKAKLTRWKSQPSYAKFDRSRRVILKTGLYGLSTYAFAGSAYGLLERNQLEINERRLPIPNLPEGLRGFSIGFICDVHSGIFMSREDMVEYAQIVASMDTDLVVIPGDFVTSQIREIYPFVEAFGDLRAPHGVYGCLGNHEFFADRSGDYLTRELEQGGIHILRNESTLIKVNGTSLNLIGVDDIRRTMNPQQVIDQSLTHVDPDAPKILLCHKPYYFETFASRNIDLTLAGHTHGGQIVFARFGSTNISPASLASKYVWGLYEQDNSKMYVTRGVGVIGVPFRVNCPPEITKIVLDREGNETGEDRSSSAFG